jgi:hypothetical protein
LLLFSALAVGIVDEEALVVVVLLLRLRTTHPVPSRIAPGLPGTDETKAYFHESDEERDDSRGCCTLAPSSAGRLQKKERMFNPIVDGC